jgi:hypothetical protein
LRLLHSPGGKQRAIRPGDRDEFATSKGDPDRRKAILFDAAVGRSPPIDDG